MQAPKWPLPGRNLFFAEREFLQDNVRNPVNPNSNPVNLRALVNHPE
jgi:hypothetical protein